MRRANPFDIVAGILLALAALLLLVMMTGCAIPVRNENNEKPLLVAATGTSVPQADGSTAHNPALPQPKADAYRPTPAIPWGMLAQVAAGLLFGTAGVGAVSRIRTLTAAVRDAASFGDDMEQAETDDDAKAVKVKHAARQAGNRTFKTIAVARSK